MNILFQELFWGITGKLKDVDQIRPIIAVIKDMSTDEKRTIFSLEIGPEMSLFLADACFSIEAAKEKADQNWENVLEILDELQGIDLLPDAEPLYIATVRAKAIVIADFLLDSSKALRVLSEHELGLSNASSFVVAATKAAIMQTDKRLDEAFVSF